MPRAKKSAEVKEEVQVKKRRRRKPKVEEKVMPVAVLEPEIKESPEQQEDNEPTETPKLVQANKPILDKKWLWVSVGVVAILAATGLSIVWVQSQNIFLGLLVIAGWLGGGYVLYKQFSGGSFTEKAVPIVIRHSTGGNGHKPDGETRVIDGEPNSLNIYSRTNELGQLEAGNVLFECMENPLGQPRTITNLNKAFYVHLWDDKAKQYRRLTISDTKYVDPAVAGEYLCPFHARNYLRFREDLTQYIAPGVLVVINILLFIGIIIMKG